VAMYHPEVTAVAAGDDARPLPSRATTVTQRSDRVAAPLCSGRSRDTENWPRFTQQWLHSAHRPTGMVAALGSLRRRHQRDSSDR
jgi:hypothetical protein